MILYSIWYYTIVYDIIYSIWMLYYIVSYDYPCPAPRPLGTDPCKTSWGIYIDREIYNKLFPLSLSLSLSMYTYIYIYIYICIYIYIYIYIYVIHTYIYIYIYVVCSLRPLGTDPCKTSWGVDDVSIELLWSQAPRERERERERDR